MEFIHKVIAFTFIIEILFVLSKASHFRGAIITWKPGANKGEIVVDYRISWRMSYGGNFYCNEDTIIRGNYIGGTGRINCFSNCGDYGTFGNLYYQCTDYSSEEDWSTGKGTLTKVLVPADENSSIYYFGFEGTAWIAVNVGGGDWRLQVKADLSNRTDTGAINTSPTAEISPIVRLQAGCNNTIKVSVQDADDDIVRCRWAMEANDECGGVCRGLPGSSLNADCTVSYETVDSLGWYAVALQVEDYINATSVTPLSSVPVQFLVYVYESSESCAKTTEFVDPTPPDDACIGVPEGELQELGIVARVASRERSISEIKTLSPLGMLKSDLYNISATDWRVNVTWDSSHSSDISNIFCFTAKESSGTESERRCITLLKDVSPPTFINGTQSPVGRVRPDQRHWKICTDTDIKQTSRTAYIRLYDSKNSLVEYIDASDGHYMSVNSTGKCLQFITISGLKEKETYYFLFDLGVVKGTQYCGADSVAIDDQLFWKISIVDVTPPVITVITNQENTNSTARLRWNVDELVTTECTVTRPNGTTEASVCNDSWVGTDLAEGRYTFVIKTTDLDGNVAYETLTWDVDTTPPVVSFTSTPSLESNTYNPMFAWTCNESCTPLCSILEQGQTNAKDLACYGTSVVWTVPTGADEAMFTFKVLVKDVVGNKAELNYTWTAGANSSPADEKLGDKDFLPPEIHLCNKGVSFTVDCTHDLEPASICNVTVTDNVDSSPMLTYIDVSSPTCGIVRTWKSSDRSGNIAEKEQNIHVVTQQPIEVVRYPGSLSLACGSLENMTNSLISLFEIKHPCDLDVKFTYEDNPRERCGILINRTWTISDNCGKTVKVSQFLKVLEAKEPLFPEDGQTGVDLNIYLRWQGASTSTQFKVYLWERNLQIPQLPSSVTYNNYHKVANLKPGTKYQWQVMLVFDSNETYLSPIWVFETREYADLTLVTIETPPVAFTDHDSEVKWTVINTGGISTQSGYWFDAVYLSWENNYENARRVKTVYQRNIVYPNDGYSSTATFTLDEKQFGHAYIFVRTDVYNNIDEYNITNNLMRSSATIHVKLTPPPDLQVISLILPGARVFSGTTVSISWTVENKGQGPTRDDRWWDRVWLSQTQTLNRESKLLYSGTHKGNLEPSVNYTATTSLKITEFITGDYFFIIETDAYDYIYEYLNENNNILAAQTPVYVVLTPPPDLVVRSIENPKLWKTGETVNVTWIVENIGHDSPLSQTYWRDEAVLVSVSGDWQRRIGLRSNYKIMKSGEIYTSSIDVYVTADMASADYNISVTADYRNELFEFTYENNNRLVNQVTVKQELPDLRVDNFSISLEYYSNFTRLNAIWKVQNIGEGKTYSEKWIDSLTSKSENNDDYITLNQIEIYEQNGLQIGNSYVRNSSFALPLTIYGKIKFRVAVDDIYRATGDKDMSNNAVVTEEISVDLRAADLIVLENITGSKNIQAGTEFSLTYQVLNTGNIDVMNILWKDRIFIAENINTLYSVHDLDESLEVDLNMKVNQTYFRTVHFSLPSAMSGDYIVVVVTDVEGKVFEDPKAHNNQLTKHISVEPAPIPDLEVSSIGAFLLDSNSDATIVTVNWQVKNTGNSMIEFQSWLDKITLKTDLDSGINTLLNSYTINLKLEAEAVYQEKRNIVLPSYVTGSIFICVTVDSLGSVYEANSKLNNFLCQDTPITIQTYTAAFLAVSVDKITSAEGSELIVPGSKVIAEFSVKNTGDLATVQSSWTDSVYLISRKPSSTADLKSDGVRVQDIIHIGILKPSQVYSVISSFSIPKGYTKNPLIYVVAFNTETSEEENDINSGGSNTTIPDSIFSSSVGSYKQPILVSFNMPNLHIETNQTLDVLQGGQPVTIDYTVQNIGNYTTQSIWFDSVYLSEDFIVDAFDVRLKTVINSFKLDIGQKVTLNISFILPLDMETKSFYLVIVCDSRNDIFEENEEDNEIRLVFTMETRSSTDIVITNVVAPELTDYGSVMDVSWNVVNNGSQNASGYKCDSVYLSEDPEWDINDMQVGTPVCSVFSLEANKGSQISNEISSATPLVPANSYNTLVKSRSNVIDLNLDNNVAIASQKTKITYNSLSVGTSKNETLRSNAFIALQVINVSADQTLVINVSSNNVDSQNSVFVKSRSPATLYDFDVMSSDPNTANQIVTIPDTIRGDYFILIENTHTLSTAVIQALIISVRYAQFEILNVYPRSLILDADTTFHITGTLFPTDIEGHLLNTFNLTTSFRAMKVYRFTSTEAYLTFHIPKDTSLTQLSLSLTSVSQKISTIYENNIEVIKGTKGYLSVTVESPGRLRNGEEGTFKVNFQNLGDSDILVPLIFIEAVGNGTIRMENQMKTEFYQKEYLVFGVTDHGPAGIMTPKSHGFLTFRTKQESLLRLGQLSMALSVSEIQPDAEATNPFLEMKNDLRPSHYTEDAWEQIWKNFKSIIGNSTLSMQKKLSAVLNEMSLGGRRIQKVDDIIKYLIDFAEAPFGETILVLESDINVQTGSNVRLVVDRVLSARSGTRKQEGSMGSGWILPLWDTKIIKIEEFVLTLEIEKKYFDFFRADEGVYIHTEIGVVTKWNSEFVLKRYKDSKELRFGAESLKLKAVVSSVDQSNLTLLYEKSLLMQIQHSDGPYISIEYNTDKRIQAIELINYSHAKEKVLYEYDLDSGFLRQVRTKSGVTRYSYNYRDSSIKCVTYDDGSMFAFEYNDLGHISARKYIVNNRIVSAQEYTYSDGGMLSVRSKPDDNGYSLTFSEEGDVILINREGFLPDKTLITKTTEATYQGDLMVLSRTFDDNGKRLTITDGNNDKIETIFNDVGQLTLFVDGGGNKYSVFLNDNGTLRNIFYPDGTNETYRYFENGHVLLTQNGLNKRYNYNEKKQLILKDIGKNDITSYEYDDTGNVVKAVNNAGEILISYNSTMPTKINYPTDTVQYQYNHNDQLTYITAEKGYFVHYKYNDLGLLRQVLDKDDNIIVSAEYNAAGKLTKKSLGNGAVVRYEYDNSTGLLKGLSNFYPNGTVASFFNYSYSTRNQRVSIDTVEGKWKFKYDRAGQVIAMTDPRGDTTEYTYDNRKNRKIVSKNGMDTQNSINEMNQYVKYGSIFYRYDKNGNVMEKNSSNREEQFSFDEDYKIKEYKSDGYQCEFNYDGLGNLQSKVCNGKVIRYLIDPRGNYGMDILEQIQEDNDNVLRIQFYHGGEQIGLIAARHGDDTMHYFLYDPLGSVVNILNSDGDLLNSYERNPFGEVVASSGTMKSTFTFVGQWGVADIEEMPGIYLMRSRWYDSYTGRFISMDPLGLRAHSKNFYAYCSNNPVHFNDPRGTCPICVLMLRGAVKGAGKGLLNYAVNTPIQDWSWGGAAGAIVTGGLKGAINPVRNFLPKWIEIAIDSGADVAGNWAKNAVDGKPYSANQAIHDAIDSAVDGAEGALEDSSATYKNINDAIKRVCSVLKTEICTPNDRVKDIAKQVADSTVQWVMSLDPNDILGPTGYGAARFIPKDTTLQYKIRFENDENATAPAQRVYIEHEYNENVDPRTFLLGEFGFGNFTKSIPVGSKFFQGVIDLTSEINIYVRVFAGLDLSKKLVVWEFQTVDPGTGEAPSDPGIGFLPPNNGTSGQGFVMFSVKLRKETSHLATVHANASIYFDQNEPIDAPNIFNTIDDSYPQMNGSVIPETLSPDSVSLSLRAQDSGSGVNHVDLFHQSGTGLVLYEAGITESSYVLNLKPGDNFLFIPVPVDQVGNRPPVDKVGQNNIINITSSTELGECECNGNGNCTYGRKMCDCFEGYYGPYCNSTLAPPEPPVLILRGGTGYVNEQIDITISARNLSGRMEDLYIVVSDYPAGTTFSKGKMDDHNRHVLVYTEFGHINMSVDKSGDFLIEIIAVQSLSAKNFTRNGNVFVKVYEEIPAVDIISSGCFFEDNDGKLLARLNTSVEFDNDSINISHSVWLILPSWVHISGANYTGNVVSISGRNLDMILDPAGRFEMFSFVVDVNILHGDNTSSHISETFEVTELCDGECEQNVYGVNCEYPCLCDELHTENCNRFNGTCSCKAGWKGPYCNITDTDACACVANHTAKCDLEDGTCLCKNGWMGASCETDVDECSNSSICDAQVNTVCQNRDWGYDCLCPVGFKVKNSSCVELDISEKESVTPNMNERATSVVVVIDYNVPVVQNLIVPAIYEIYRDKARYMLVGFYSESLGSGFVRVIIRSLGRGSLVIDHVVITKDDVETSRALAVAIMKISNANTTLMYDNKAVSAADVRVDNLKADDICKVYTSISPCNQSECTVEQNIPTCSPIEAYSGYKGNTVLYIGLAVIAAVLLLVIAITVGLCVRRKTLDERRQRSNHHSLSRQHLDENHHRLSRHHLDENHDRLSRRYLDENHHWLSRRYWAENPMQGYFDAGEPMRAYRSMATDGNHVFNTNRV